MCGKVVTVAEKIPSDPNAVAWNHAQGSTFVNVRWNNWPQNVCDLALSVYAETGLHFSGIDIMTDQDDEAWFIEANSAPSLPPNDDGSPSYRHRCVATALAYHYHRNDWSDLEYEAEGWRGLVHPGVWGNHPLWNTPSVPL